MDFDRKRHDMLFLVAVLALVIMLFVGLGMRSHSPTGMVVMESSFEPFSQGAISTLSGSCYSNFDSDNAFTKGKVIQYVMDDTEGTKYFESWDECLTDYDGEVYLREYFCKNGRVEYTDGRCTNGYVFLGEEGCRCN